MVCGLVRRQPWPGSAPRRGWRCCPSRPGRNGPPPRRWWLRSGMVPLQPPSTVPCVGSRRMAKSPSRRSAVVADQAAQPALHGLHFLMVVKHKGDVLARRRAAVEHCGRQRELHRDAALHVRGPAAVEDALARDARLPGGRDRAAGAFRGRQRHGVQVPGEDDALRAGPGSVRAMMESPSRTSCSAGMVRRASSTASASSALVAGHTVDVDQGGGQQGDVLAQVQGTGAVSAVTIHCIRGPAQPGGSSSTLPA